MAFNNLGLQEPSTITARVGTVTIARGSTTEHQEIMVLGDVSSSNAIARVLSATPASTEFGLAVRVVEQPSTLVTVSTGSVRVHQSTAADLQATVAQASTVWQVQVGGYVAPSTTVNVSSVSGVVTVRPSDTNWASSAGFHFDSSGALQIAGTFSASTTVNVSSVAGVVTVSPLASSNSSVYLSVRLSDGTSFIPISQDYTDGSTYSSLVAPGVAFNNSSNNTFRTVGLTTPFPVQMTDSSNASVKPGDATNQAIRVNVVAGAAGGSTVMTVSTGSIGLAGVYDSSNALQKVGDSANQAIRVNVVAGAQYDTDYLWIIFNRCYDSDYGFAVGSDIDSSLTLNQFFVGNVVWGMTDSAGVYAARSGDSFSNCAFTSRASGNKYYYHNTAHNSSGHGFCLPGSPLRSAVAYYDNIVDGVIASTGRHFFIDNASTTIVSGGNLLAPNYSQNIGGTVTTLAAPQTLSGNSLVRTTAEFANLIGENYHLNNQSAAVNIDTGGNAQALYDSYLSRYGVGIQVNQDGSPRPSGLYDAGAYELQSRPVGVPFRRIR